MMVIVDTSVWIDYLKGGNEKLTRQMNDLLDGDVAALAAPVRIEIISGASKGQMRTLKRVLSALPTYLPSPSVWDIMEGWVDVACQRGLRFGAMDLLIAGIANEHGAAIWSLDRDFERMAGLGWIRLF